MPVPVIALAKRRTASLGNASRRHAAAPGNTSHGRRLRIAPLALLVALCGGAAMLPLAAQAQSLALEAHRASADVALASITLRDAWDGSADAYAALSAQCSAVAAAPARLEAALPPSGKRAERDALRYDVERIARQIDVWVQDCVRIADLREAVLAAHEVRVSFEAAMPQQMVLLDRVVMRMLEQGASADQIYMVMRQFALLERIRARIREVMEAGSAAPVSQDFMLRDANVYIRMLDALVDGDPELSIPRIDDADAVADLRVVREQFGPLADRVADLSNDLDVVDAGDRLRSLALDRDFLIEDLRGLASRALGKEP
jgi:hypothetical protein